MVELALSIVETAERHGGPDALLTAREREVLELIAVGHSSREIADMLIISNNTVKTHVNSVLNKLGAETRAQAVAVATRHGLL
jgi:DNA-binding CsgD family transcriptional regulator